MVGRRSLTRACPTLLASRLRFSQGTWFDGWSTPPRRASPEEIEELAGQSLLLEDATPEEIITWAVGKYHPRLTMATAFGPKGA